MAGLSLCWSYIPYCWKSHVIAYIINGPRREKTCLQGFRKSSRDKLENLYFTCTQFTHDSFQKANNKGHCCSQAPENRISRVEAHLIIRNPVISIYDYVRLNQVSSATETS